MPEAITFTKPKHIIPDALLFTLNNAVNNAFQSQSV